MNLTISPRAILAYVPFVTSLSPDNSQNVIVMYLSCRVRYFSMHLEYSFDVQWWTADEYEAWMNEQKKEMESLIGTGDGWYDGEGVFHEFTQESVAAMMDSYKGTLESIKKGVLYSKDNGDGDTYSMIPPTEDVVSFYSVDVTKDNGKTVHIGDYSTVEELDKAISDAVKNGQLTQEEADAVHQ